MNARGDRIAWSAPAYDSVEFSTFDDAERVANAERDTGDGAAAAAAAGSNVSQGLPHCSLCKANSICSMSRVTRHTSCITAPALRSTASTLPPFPTSSAAAADMYLKKSNV